MEDQTPKSRYIHPNNTPGRYTDRDIIEYLDKVPYTTFFFIDLEHPYFYTANSRLTLFGDETRWAIVFEKSGYSYRAGRIELELYFFGNCLENLEPSPLRNHFYNSQYFTLISGEELGKDIEKVRLRERYVQIPTTKEGYLKWIPDIVTRNYPKEVSFEDLVRYLAYEYEALCRATDQELRHCIPDDLPKIMAIDEWHHKSYDVWEIYDPPGIHPTREDGYVPPGPPPAKVFSSFTVDGDPPSSYETYRLIADVLETKDPAKFKPTLNPNNHWINWPAAGSL